MFRAAAFDFARACSAANLSWNSDCTVVAVAVVALEGARAALGSRFNNKTKN